MKLTMDSDNLCSICLDVYCKSNPPKVTSCKHEFHLKCILEWFKKGSDCPICSRRIRLEDSASQELLEGIERNRGRKRLNIAPRRANEDSSTSNLKPGENSKTDAPNSPKKQKTETRKTKSSFEADEEDDVYEEAMKMLPAYIASAVGIMNKSVGTRKAERLKEKSDEDILKSTVSHLMKTTVLLVEHADRMVDLNEESRKTREELDVAREEIAELLREKAKMREELEAAQIEIDSHCRESVNAFQRARRAHQASIKLKAELQMLKGSKGEKRKVYSTANEAETSRAIDSFKQTEEFEMMRDNLYMEGAHALLEKIKEERPKWDLSFVEEDD